MAAAEGRRHLQGQQLSDKVDSAVSEEAAKREGLEQAMREQAHALRESVQTGDRANGTRLEALQEEVQTLGHKMRDVLAEALKAERRGVEGILGKAQGQVTIRGHSVGVYRLCPVVGSHQKLADCMVLTPRYVPTTFFTLSSFCKVLWRPFAP